MEKKKGIKKLQSSKIMALSNWDIRWNNKIMTIYLNPRSLIQQDAHNTLEMDVAEKVKETGFIPSQGMKWKDAKSPVTEIQR